MKPWKNEAAFEWDAHRMLQAALGDEHDGDDDAEVELAYVHDLAAIQNLPEAEDPRVESAVERVRRYTER